MRHGTDSIIVLLAAGILAAACTHSRYQNVREYIAAGWDRTVRVNTCDTPDSLIGLPEPYTVPCEDGMFNELYYWDTYFTNEGLIADGRIDLAKGNVNDIIYLIGRYGFMPNGNRLWYLSRSQPPFATAMAESVFNATRDTAWLASVWPVLCREHEFWRKERMTPAGLNRYGGSPDEKLLKEFTITASSRLGTDFRALGWEEDRLSKFGYDCVAECESGWDFNPRFDRRCGDFCPIDLNAILYKAEKTMASFATVLGCDDPGIWESRAAERKERILQLCYDPDKKAFFDYDFVHSSRSDVLSAAPFALLWAGMLDGEHAESVRRTLESLEFDCGIAVCAKAPYEFSYQWSYPNSWPPVTFMAVKGLAGYGFREDAERLAGKYLRATERLFRRTGQLWEKMDATTGSIPADSEYGTPAMLGWTAGTFVCFDEFLTNE